MSSLGINPQIAQALRDKLKWIIKTPIAENIYDIYKASKKCDKALLPIAEEFKNYVMQVFSHYYEEEELFEYESEIIGEIRKAISSVHPEIPKKIKEIKTEEFKKSDLQAKFMLFKKVLKLLSEIKPSKSKIVAKLVIFHFLRNPVITELTQEIFNKSKDEELVASTKNNAEYVYEYIYRNIENFALPVSFIKKFIKFYFNYQIKKNKIFKRMIKGSHFHGNEPNISKEIVKGILTKPNGDIYYSEWQNKKMISGFLFLKKGDIYKGGFKNNKAHGLGYRQNKNGAIYHGQWDMGYFQEGYQKLIYSENLYGELLDMEAGRTGVSIYQHLDKSLIENHKKKSDLERTLNMQGPPGTYIGEFKEETRSGTGSMYYQDGSAYHGEWEEDKKHGQGVYYGVNNEKYCGEWLYGTYHGHGEKVYEDGGHYVGEWKMGMMHGEGVLVMKDGIVKDGEWEEDRFVSDKVMGSVVSKKEFKKSRMSQSQVSGFKMTMESVLEGGG
jgi:hypothetical protein